MKFAWSTENECRSKGEMRGEEMGLWIVLIDIFVCVCVPALTGFLADGTTVLKHTVYDCFFNYGHF